MAQTEHAKRCETCKWWQPVDPDHAKWLNLPDGWRECERFNGPSLKAAILSTHAQDEGVFTAPDFGCVQWEKDE